MNQLTPIPTRIFGYQFRSRTEARWAVVFKALGIKFVYEHEGYQLNINGKIERYLPDFYMPKIKCFVEIKGQAPTAREQQLAYALSRDSGWMVHILSGSIPSPERKNWRMDGFMIYTFSWSLKPDLMNVDPDKINIFLNDVYMINKCPNCQKVNFARHGALNHLPCGCSKYKGNELSIAVTQALLKGRSASFEFLKK